MDVFGVGFLVGISVVGGFIALFADNLGRKLGKKRLSVKAKRVSIRPRRVAQIATFTSGVVIPLLTVGIVALLSADVRQWFAEGPAIIRQRNELRGEVDDLRKDKSGLEETTKRLEGERQAKAAQVNSLDARLKSAQAKLADYAAKISDLTVQIRTASAKVQTLTASTRRLTQHVQAQQSRLAAAKVELAAIEKLRDQLQTSYDVLQADIDAAYDKNRDLTNENLQLTRDIEGLKQEIARLKQDSQTQKAENDRVQKEYEKEIADKQRELELTALELDSRKGDLKELQKSLEEISGIWLNSRRLPMIFSAGEELAREQIRAGVTRAEAEGELSRLIRSARAVAEARGAKSKGQIPSAGIMQRLGPDNRMLSAEMQIASILDRLTGLSEEVVLVATSSLNAFEGEPVSLDIQSFRNPPVFALGELIAEGRVDGDRPEDVIVQQIQEFISETLRERLREKGMVPRLGSAGGFGMLPQKRLLELMATAKANNRRVRIQALAPQEIRAGDLVELEFRIR